MNATAPEGASPLRRSMYWVLVAAAAGMMLGRIFAVDSVDRFALEEVRVREVLGGHSSLAEYAEWKHRDLVNQGLRGPELDKALAEAVAQQRQRLDQRRLRRPFLSANDRSRWAAVRALVEPEMRVPGAPYAIDKVIQEPGWDTIDMVMHTRRYKEPSPEEAEPAPGERLWRQDGYSDGDKTADAGHLYSSKPPLLTTLVAVPYWVVYNVTGMTLGEHPYAVGRSLLVLLNVLPMLLYFALLGRLVERFGATDWGRLFVMAAAAFGTFLTTFAVTLNNHLPAAVCAAVTLYAAVRIGFDDERRWRYFVVAGLFAALTVVCEMPAVALAGLLTLALLWKAPIQTLLGYLPAAALVAAGFFGTNYIAHKSFIPPYLHRGGGGEDDWYDYAYQRGGRVIESYWRNPTGVDAGEPCWPKYALHVTVGHHGIFSLTPVWLLSVAGACAWLARPSDRRLRHLAWIVALGSLVVLAFYLQPQKGSDYRNYGGVSSGLRWMFWLAPAWLVLMLPTADWMAARRWRRGFALVLLAASALSAGYPTWNPWVHPWLMDWMAHLGWV
jgi:hypothetical protein